MDRAASVISILMLMPVLSFITWKVAKEKDRATKSLKKFTAMCPKAYRTVFLISAWFIVGIFALVYFYNGICFDDYDPDALLLGFVIALVFVFLWLATTLWKLRVEGNTLTYITFFGLKKQTSIDRVDCVKISDQGSLIVYANGKRFGTVNSDFKCMGNFLQRCQQENISIVPHSARPITKCGLYVKSMKPIFVLALVLAIIFLIIAVVLFLREGADPVPMLIFTPFMSVFLIALISPLPLRGILQIARQESLLGFRFDEEMKKQNAQGAGYVNDVWFVDIDLTHVVAFRRDFIQSIGGIGCNEGQEMQVRVTGADGKIMKVRSSRRSLAQFRSWFKE